MELIGEISEKISNLSLNGEKFLFIIDFEGRNAEVYTPAEALEAGIFFEMNHLENAPGPPNIEKKDFKAIPVPYSLYLEAFNKVQQALKRGDTYLLNLTFATEIETGYSLEELYHQGNAKFKLLYKDKFVVFSPERFIKISGGTIVTNPMKGTILASVTDARNILLENTKELYEHNTIVDLLRNDLSIVASNVKVERFRYIDKVTTSKGDLLQASSMISGELSGDYKSRLGELVMALLPAGSVTGAPKQRTVEIINEVENYQRGYYTGVFGYFDGNDLDMAVSIRFIERIGDKLYYKSGGGITSLSDPLEEYNEMQNKIYVPFI